MQKGSKVSLRAELCRTDEHRKKDTGRGGSSHGRNEVRSGVKTIPRRRQKPEENVRANDNETV